MFDFIRNHIVYKTMLAILACIAIVSAVSGIFFYITHKNKMFNDYNVEINNIRQIIEGSYAIHLWNIQPDSIISLNETVLSTGHCLAITIYDKDIDGMYHVNISTLKKIDGEKIIFKNKNIPFVLEDKYIDVSKGLIEYQGAVVGKYELFHTNEHIYDYLKGIVYNIFFVYITITIGVTAILLVLLNKFVIRKMFSLVEFTKGMAGEKRFDKRVSIQGSDEVSVLADSINEMLEQIELKDRQKDEASNKLSQSESYLKNIFDASPDAIFICEAKQGVIVDVNNSTGSIFKYDQDELMGKYLGIISSGEQDYDQQDAHAWLIKARDEGPQRFEWLSRRSDGASFWTEIDVRFAQIGGKDRFIVLARDITDRKRSEEELRMQSLVLDQIEDRVTVTDLSGRITYVNQAAINMLGFTREEIQTHSTEIYGQDPQRGATQREILEATMRNGHWRGEVVNYSKDGSERILDCRTQVVRDEKDRPVALCGISTDITQRRQAEQEREKLQTQLHQAQKMESVGILAGGVAHDFNNLLQVIRGNMELLVQGNVPDTQSQSRISTITKSLDRAAQLVQQLLLFSRKAESQKVHVDLNQEVESVARILKRTIPKMINLELHLAPDVSPVSGDPMQIEMLLINLANNAVDAMPGGGKLSIETSNVELDQNFARLYPGSTTGRHVLLTVQDTGFGMDKDIQEHIFDPFFTTKEVGKGTGLGLASVYGIVKGHGGYIQCYSEPGLGTTFRVYLPAGEQDDMAVEEQKQAAPLQGGQETILVVDDEPDILELAREAMGMLGYSVKSAVSGEEALQVYQDHGDSIDMVLLDLNMPGMGGYKCLQELLRLDPSVKVVIASGYTANGHGRDALSAGARGFMGKPYQLNQLAAIIRETLDAD